jgi:hypothetical protein
VDCGLISNKPRDSLTKTPGRTGMRQSDPLDHDPAARTLSICDLILIVCYGSGGWRATRARGRRWVAGIQFPRWRFAGVGRSRPFGLHFGRGLAREKAHGMPKPPRGFARVRGGCSGSRHGIGGSMQRSSPACALTCGSEHQGWDLRPGMRVRCRSKLDRAVSGATGGFPWRGGRAGGGRTPAAVVLMI